MSRRADKKIYPINLTDTSLQNGNTKFKAKKKQETFDAWEANKNIEELTRNLESQENNLAEINQTVKIQKESINVRDQDIRNLQDAIIERDNI